MKNSDYWEDRIANEVWAKYNSLEEKNVAILNMYRDAEKSMIAEIAKLESRVDDLSRSQKYQLNHLKSLKKEINTICEKIGTDVEKLAKNGVYDAIENNQKDITDLLGAHFSKPSQKAMEQMLNTPWHGSYFSERLWGDTGKLANEVNDIIKKGITQGKTIAEMSFQLSSRMNKSMNYAHNLVRTETMNTLNRSSKDAYKKSGIKFVRWWAAQDERECGQCGANHGKIFPIDKAPILPCHPGCRCTYIPVLDDELSRNDIQDIYNLSDEEMYSMNKYISGDFYVTNDSLRRGYTLNDEEMALADNLDKALDKFPNYNGKVTRSLYFYSQEQLDGFVNQCIVGEKTLFKDYIATTKGEVYNPDSQIEIVINESTLGKDISLLNQKEQEVLYSRDNLFTTVDILEKDGKIYIYLEEEQNE